MVGLCYANGRKELIERQRVVQLSLSFVIEAIASVVLLEIIYEKKTGACLALVQRADSMGRNRSQLLLG